MRLIPYPTILETMTRRAWRCLYPGGGAFAPPGTRHAAGWITRPDPTLRESARPLVRLIPDLPTLAQMARQAWIDHFPGPAWMMPMSHWGYELRFGAGPWLPQALQDLGLDPASLTHLTTADALEFPPDQADRFQTFLHTLLQNLTESDFTIAWPDTPILCTIHHHQQLWWTTDQSHLLTPLRDKT